MEYPPPNNPNATIFNDHNQDSHTEVQSSFDESLLVNYVRKSGDTMQGGLSCPEIQLYGTNSKITFQDGTTMSSYTGDNTAQSVTNISYDSGTSTTHITGNTLIDNLATNTFNASHLAGTTSNVQDQLDLNASDIVDVQNVNTTQSNDIAAIKTKTDKIFITNNDVNIQGRGITRFQVGNVNDYITGVGSEDDGTYVISCGDYTGTNVGVNTYNLPSTAKGIFGALYGDFWVCARGNQTDEGLILSGNSMNYGTGDTTQGAHMFINKTGSVTIGPNCKAKYAEGFKLNVEGTTKLDGNITIPAGRTLNGISTTTLGYLDATSSVQTQFDYILGEVGTLKTSSMIYDTSINSLQTQVDTNTSAITAIQDVNTTQSTDITNLKTITNGITRLTTGDIKIKTTGTAYLQVGNVNDTTGTNTDKDDGSNAISIGNYTGTNSGSEIYNLPVGSATSGIFGTLTHDFWVCARADNDDQGLILSGTSLKLNAGDTFQGPHLFINRLGQVSIGPNCRTKYTEGFKFNVQGTTKLGGDVTVTGTMDLSGQNITNVNNLSVTNINGSPYTSSPSFTSGTLTPILQASGSSGSLTYSKNTGKYQKVGGMIHFVIDLQLATKSGMSGDLYIFVDLPNNPVSSISTRQPVTIGYYSGISENKICALTAYIDPTRNIYFDATQIHNTNNTFTSATLTQGQINSNFYVTLSGSYFY